MADNNNFVNKDFQIVDYVLFVVSLIIPIAIGVYYGFFGGTKRSSRENLLGSGRLGIFPVAMALIATYMSAISVMGYPSEIYHYGGMMLYYLVAYLFVFPLVAYVFLPVMHPLKLTSVYEYLEMRFSKTVRQMAAFIFCFQVFLYLAVVLYAPALALSSVTPINVTASILVTGLIATFYTSLGGSNAVVWTSTVQMLLIVGGTLAVLISGSINAGGMDVVWAKGVHGLRVYFTDIRPDPRVRHSVWSVVIGGTFTILTLFTVNQMGVQRYFSMPTLRSAQTMVLLNVPLNYICTTIFFLIGLVLYNTYGQCDPMMLHKTAKPDQLLPFYVADKLHFATGLPGLFVSGLYGAGLSTLSSGFTALAMVFLEDVVKPLFRWFTKGSLSPRASFIVSKLLGIPQLTLREAKAATVRNLACFCGLLVVGLAFAVGVIKFTVVQVSLSIFGIVGGPVLGIFIMGMFLPFTNSKGAVAGILAGLTFTMWLGFGAIAAGITPYMLPLSTDGCSSNGTSALNVTMPEWQRNRVRPASAEDSILVSFYEISYQYYSLIGVLVTLIIGVAVSCLTGCQNGNFVKPTLLLPIVRRFGRVKETYELKIEKFDDGEGTLPMT